MDVPTYALTQKDGKFRRLFSNKKTTQICKLLFKKRFH